MWTITTDPKVLDPGTALKTITHRWHLLCRNLLRLYPGIKFFRVLEFTQSGLPHIHVIFNKRVEWRLLQSMVMAQQFGKVLHFKVLPRDQAFSYLTKYMTKALGDYELARQLRSRAWSASVAFLPRVTYFDGATEYDLIYSARLGSRLDRVLHDCEVHSMDERSPPS